MNYKTGMAESRKAKMHILIDKSKCKARCEHNSIDGCTLTAGIRCDNCRAGVIHGLSRMK